VKKRKPEHTAILHYTTQSQPSVKREEKNTTTTTQRTYHAVRVHLVGAHEPVLGACVAVEHDGLGKRRGSALGDFELGIVHPRTILPHL